MWNKPSAPSGLKDASVRALRCEEGRARQEISIGQGLIIDVRAQADGTYSKTWLYRFRAKSGKSRRLTLGQYPTVPVREALRRHTELRLLVQSGRDPWLEQRQEREKERLALSGVELVERYLRDWAYYEERPGVPRKRSAHQDERILRRDFLPKYGTRPVGELTRSDMDDILRQYKNRAPRSHDQVRSIISGMFTWAIREGLCVENPCAAIRKVQSSKAYSRERYLDEDELRALLQRLAAEVVQTDIRDALLFQLHTAARLGEVTRMRWADLSNGVWTIPAEHSKNKRPHVLPLPEAANRIIATRPRVELSRWVFPGRGKDVPKSRATIAKYVDRLNQEFGWERFTSHDLRRTAATHMSRLGVHDTVISQVLNHTEQAVVWRYIRHEFVAEKREALALWAVELARIAAGRAAHSRPQSPLG